MKKRILLLILSAFVIYSCSEEKPEKASGYLTLNISQSSSVKADIEITDFTLRILDGSVEILKERIGDLPEQISLPAGRYTIEAYSAEFYEPKFEMPFYYGKTTVDIEANETATATLICSLGNAGVKIVWPEIFSTLFGTYQAQIDCVEGYLTYSSVESRTGYFLPGTVTITINADGLTINGGTITLEARDLVTIIMQPKAAATGDLTIEMIIDVSTNNREIELIVDPDNTASSETNPYTIAQAIARQGENEVWITGYIVGSKPSSGYDFWVTNLWQNTNIVLADDISETDDRSVIFVELSSATYRNPLNLINNPTHLQRKVLIRGNLRQYQSRAGLRDIRGYSFP